jgi:hypothetical protein
MVKATHRDVARTAAEATIPKHRGKKAARIDRDVAHAAAWGLKPPPTAASSPIVLVSVKEHRHGALCGFATVKYCGLKLIDCTLWSSAGKQWVSLPAKAQIGEGGRQIVIGGARQYTPTAEWPSREVSDRFSAAVIAQVKQRYPEIFEPERIS